MSRFFGIGPISLGNLVNSALLPFPRGFTPLIRWQCSGFDVCAEEAEVAGEDLGGARGETENLWDVRYHNGALLQR